jgi:uncharacterized protein
MKIGIVGSGVSGLVSAYLLQEKHEVELLEMNAYTGGHTHTQDVTLDGVEYAINTGFIVFNKRNYPNFMTLIERLDVPYQPAPMSFSVKNTRNGLEYGFATLNAIFAQRRNLFSPSFLRMLREIGSFRREFETLLADPESDKRTLGEHLQARGYSRRFVQDFLVPFGAAIWSADPDKMGEFPLGTFVQFFKNHGFLAEGDLLQWHTLKGGSRSYVTRLESILGERIVKNTKVTSVERLDEGIGVEDESGTTRVYDEVVLALHSDQALRVLKAPTRIEEEVLGAMPYQPNNVVLHTDTSVLPGRRQTWSSWNYCIPGEETDRCTVTYDMNILQSVDSTHEFLVTLNQSDDLDEKRTIQSYVYDHPIYTKQAVAAQGRHSEISGVDRIHYAGAYWGYGFHEDGVKSALAACAGIDTSLRL